MLRMTFTRRNRAGLVAVIGFLALAGCRKDESAFVEPAPGPVTRVEITGSVGDGPVTDASIAVTSKTGDVLAAIRSDMSGGYSASIEARDDLYPLFVSATGGTDLVTNMAPDLELLGSVTEPGERAVANINPITTLIIELARNMDGGLTADNIRDAEGTVVAVMDTGLVTMHAGGPLATPVNASNISEVVRASESLAEIVRRTRDLLLNTASVADADEVVRAIGSDLVDGIIEGNGGVRSDARLAAVTSIVSAQVVLESMANELHVNGTDATNAMRAAIAQVSPGTPQPTLDELTITAGMISIAKLGISAAAAVDSDPAIAELAVATDGLQAGMDAALVESLLPAGYRQSLESTAVMVANGSDSVIEAVNSTIRNGGTPPPPTNRAPTISGSPPATVNVGETYSFTPDAADADGDALTFGVTNLPSWASFDTTTGTLTGTPAAADADSYLDIVIDVSDGSLSDSLGPFSISVVADNQPPVISGSGGATLVVGEAYSFLPTASDPENDPLTFSIANRPSWASFDATTGRLSGTAAAGSYPTIIIRVSDGDLTTSLAPFTITVTVPNSPPTIGGSPPAQVAAGSAYSFTPTANDADGDRLTFSITGRPAWAGFNTASGRLSGTPDNADAGTYNNIRIRVSDGTDSATLGPFSITVTAVNTPPTISGTPPAEINANSAYSFTPTAADADGDVLTFSITGKPAWANFASSSGRLSGTPGDADFGTYDGIRITVTDGTDSATLGPFSITVTAVNTPPTISGTPPAEINANSAYSFTPTAADADGDVLTFSITGKPAWANFASSSGRLSGTPGDADVGTYDGIRITVTDGTDSATLGPFSITVNTVSLGSVTLTWNAPIKNVDGTQLTDLIAYKIYWGTTPGTYPNSVRIDNPGVTTFVLENLAPGTYEFAATAINSQEQESGFSVTTSYTVP